MKSGFNPRGFTIVETLIVLAVTSAILVSALSLVAGSQNKTQFTQAINDINQQIVEVSNNVSDGYYSNTISGKTCQTTPGTTPPTFAPSSSGGLGTNTGCIYVGRVIQFTDDDSFYVHNVVGRQQTGVPAVEVTSIKEAVPLIIEPGANTQNDFPSTTEDKKLKNGIKPAFMKFKNGGNWISTTGLAFMSSFGSVGTSPTDLQSGALSTEFGPTNFNPPMDLTNTLNTKDHFVDLFGKATDGFGDRFDTYKNPDSGVVICFDSGSTNQYGVITIGGKGQRNTTKLEIKTGNCSNELPLYP